MIRIHRMFALVLMFMLFAVAQTMAQQEVSLPDLVARVENCVYRVEVRGSTAQTDLAGKTMTKSFGPNVGTGFSVTVRTDPLRSDPFRPKTADGRTIETIGYVVTNSHVVCPKGARFAAPPTIRLRNEAADFAFDGELVGHDTWSDLAVIRITRQSTTNLTGFLAADRLFQPKIGRLKTLDLGDPGKLRVGESVVAVGFGYDLEGMPSVSRGIVGALNRRFREGLFSDLIQTDASINPGNSGGPLLNLRGEVVGVNTYTQLGHSELRIDVQTLRRLLNENNGKPGDAVLTLRGVADASQGLNFARSTRTAAPIIERLIHEGKIERPSFGLLESSRPIRHSQVRGLGVDQGILVLMVFPGSPAERAGLRRGDVIVRVNDQPVTAFGDWNNVLALAPSASTYSIGYWRYAPAVVEPLIRGNDRLASDEALNEAVRKREFKVVNLTPSR